MKKTRFERQRYLLLTEVSFEPICSNKPRSRCRSWVPSDLSGENRFLHCFLGLVLAPFARDHHVGFSAFTEPTRLRYPTAVAFRILLSGEGPIPASIGGALIRINDNHDSQVEAVLREMKASRLFGSPKARERVLDEFNRSTLDDVKALGGDQGMDVLKEMNELGEAQELTIRESVSRIDVL